MKDCLNSFITERLLAVFDFSILDVRKHNLQNALKDVSVVILSFYELRDGGHIRPLLIAQCL